MDTYSEGNAGIIRGFIAVIAREEFLGYGR